MDACYCYNAYLEPFQVGNIKEESLSKIDKFYRQVCDPFHQLTVDDVIKDIDAVLEKQWQTQSTEGTPPSSQQDIVPLSSFLDYLKQKP